MRTNVAGPLGPRNAQVMRLRSLLNDRAARRTDGAFVAEGLRLIEGLLDRQAPVRALYVAPDAHDADRVEALLARVGDDVAIYELAPGVAPRISATVTPQAVFAEVALPTDVALDGPAVPALVLVGIQDPGNAGTMVRAAEAFGFNTVVFVGEVVDPWNPKVVRAAAGSHAGVRIVEAKDAMELIDQLRGVGGRVVATVARDGVAPDAVDLSGPVALVIGSEAHGLDADVITRCDAQVTIPMQGAIESLNAGMAAGVLMFEAARQRGWASA